MQIKIFISKVASFLTIFAMVLSMVGFTPATARAAPVRQFSASTSPATVSAGANQSFTVTFTNSPNSTDNIKSARLSLPAGFTLQNTPTPTVGGVTDWEVCVAAPDIQTGKTPTGTQVLPGSSLTLTFSALVPLTGGSFNVGAQAFKNESCNPGNGAEFDGNLTPIVVTVSPPTCSDGIQNQDETGVDTGGVCTPPPVDACPNETTDPGVQTSGPCNSDDVCPNDVGIQTSTDQCTPPPPVYECSDNIDNDEDGQIDYPNDLGCTSADDNSESPNPVTQYTLTVNSGGNGTAGTSGLYNDGTVVVLTATPDANYHFVNWTGDTDCTDGSVTVGSNLTCTANFAIDTFTITATSGANGSVSPAGVSVQNYGASQAYQITPDSGYYVSDVLVDSVSVGAVTVYNFSNVTANHTISATFAINPACSDAISNDEDNLIDANDPGCWTNPNDSETYDPNDTDETDLIQGCTDETAFNFNPDANYNDGSCVPVVTGCMDNTANNYNAEANTSDNSCTYTVLGCTDPEANNYNPNANTPDDSCTYTEGPVYGCTDPEATNYNPNADIDDESCTYPQEPVYACSDGIDNDEDGSTDAVDRGCHTDGDMDNPDSYNPNDNDETNSRGGGTSGSRISSGQVLGASTSCGIYVDKFLRKGYRGNNPDAVNKLQQFLNDYTAAGLSVDSKFGPKTETALKAFQTAHADKVLTPWNLKAPTGIFYLTTQTEVNNIMCPELGLPIPTNLVPFSRNPETPKA